MKHMTKTEGYSPSPLFQGGSHYSSKLDSPKVWSLLVIPENQQWDQQTFYTVLPVSFINDLEESKLARRRIFRFQNYPDIHFHPLDCETNVPIMQMSNWRWPAMVTKSIFETYVAFIKWPDFQKLEPSMPSPGFQDYAATPAVTIASKRFYLFIYLQGTFF